MKNIIILSKKKEILSSPGLSELENMIKENYDLAIKLANKALAIANLDIVSSSVALRFLCRAELLNKNY